ncbi:hypothetical protein DESUT3_14050 [Desulfuromonas versatilis]|uniref:Methyltransferase domain-containing protein n=1 Tax=Desulfuromonas versatilis TaxID=2802975 RepID=A0ABM8HR10_9BACT|nr:methyltransferase domain-containing protein [Desulfuromonas versatilis]BCR04336.1 hypothetical protein DESUT3_14050 [Desulfuromonas versatilis]
MFDFLLPDLRDRDNSPEKMDRADADLAMLLRTIRQFQRINLLFSASRRLLRQQVFSLMERDPERVYSLLDVGAGGCDIACWAAREARRRRLKLQITALDNDPRIFPVARQAISDYPEIRLVEGNALALAPLGRFDFIFSNHFLHHLGWAQIEIFLRGAIAGTRLALVMNDLKRSPWAYLGGTLSIGLLAPRSFAFFDGRLSIRKGFRAEELREFARKHFPETPIRVFETPPARVVMVCRGTDDRPCPHRP